MSLKKGLLYAGAFASVLLGSIKADACTTVLVGKNASEDGSTIIARNEDKYAASPKYYYSRAANSNPTHFVSSNTASGFTIDLPAEQQKYNTYQEYDTSSGLYEEGGINESNVGMSATETLNSTPPASVNDPLMGSNAGGLDEDATLTVVLPYIHSAKEGVERLGQIVEEHGAYKTHGSIFSDKNEIWYFEIVSGHNWIAVKVPDDKYAVIVNRLNIKEVDLDDTENVMTSTNFKKIAKLTGSYEKGKKFNVAAAFDNTKQDASDLKNAPRTWDGQRTLSPSLVGSTVPSEPTATFDKYQLFLSPDKKISIDDVENVLSLHYNNTEYDTYADEPTKTFEAISKTANMESHIIQMRQDKPAATTGIQWVEMGVTASSTWVPFFSGISDTPQAYKEGQQNPDFESAYWTFNMTYALSKNYYGKTHAVTVMGSKDAYEKFITPARTAVLDKMTASIATVDAEYATKFATYIALQGHASDAAIALENAAKPQAEAQKTADTAKEALTAAQSEQTKANTTLADAQQAERDAKQAAADAKTASDTAKTDAAKKLYEEKAAAYKKAQDASKAAKAVSETAKTAMQKQQKDYTTKNNALNTIVAAVKKAQSEYDKYNTQAQTEKANSEAYLTQVSSDDAAYAISTWQALNENLIRVGSGWKSVN